MILELLLITSLFFIWALIFNWTLWLHLFLWSSLLCLVALHNNMNTIVCNCGEMGVIKLAHTRIGHHMLLLGSKFSHGQCSCLYVLCAIIKPVSNLCHRVWEIPSESRPQFYIQLVYKQHLRTWIILSGCLGRLGNQGSKGKIC